MKTNTASVVTFGDSGMGQEDTQPEKSANLDHKQSEVITARSVARRATSTTERLCHLYVTLTQNMDPSVVRYYLQHDEVRKVFRKRGKIQKSGENETVEG